LNSISTWSGGSAIDEKKMDLSVEIA